MSQARKHRFALSLISTVLGVGTLWVVMIALQAGAAAQADFGDSSTSNRGPVATPANPVGVSELSLTLAAYQAWFGLDSHIKPPPYTSTDPILISNHIAAALAQGIDGFVVDWYGPEAGVPNDEDRKFIDEATAELLQQSDARGFRVALMYDEGTVSTSVMLTQEYNSRVISDLVYARRYFTMPAYLHISDHPALFIFPYEEVDPYIEWGEVKDRLGITVTLLDKNPDPLDLTHDDQFDGFYAWVQPITTEWSTDGADWGSEYLKWFYETMSSPTYTSNIAIGGVWPGFDDTLASWSEERYIWRRCGQTWRDTWALADEYNPSIVMIDTWNDFEEGTDIEYGIGECLMPSRQVVTCRGGRVVYTHTVANTGKFTDTFSIAVHSSNDWPVLMNLDDTTITGHASTALVVSLTVPGTLPCGMQDTLVITATSGLSTAVRSRVVDTTTARCCVYLPFVFKDYPDEIASELLPRFDT